MDGTNSADPVGHVLLGSLHTASVTDVQADVHGPTSGLNLSNNLLDMDDGNGYDGL